MKCAVWLFGVFVSLTTSVLTVQAQCQTCGLSGVACTSLTNFQPCFASSQISTGSVGGTCPSGTYCNANSSSICVYPATLLLPSCIPDALSSRCGECSSTGRFACLNATTFGFCFGASTASRDVLFNCPSGQYCNVDEEEPGFCTTNATKITCLTNTVSSSTTQPSWTTSTTISADFGTTSASSGNATTWCASRKSTGRFAQPQDPSCRSYYYCMVYKYRFRGVSFECVGETYFSSSIQKCVSSQGLTCFDGRLITANTTSSSFVARQDLT